MKVGTGRLMWTGRVDCTDPLRRVSRPRPRRCPVTSVHACSLGKVSSRGGEREAEGGTRAYVIMGPGSFAATEAIEPVKRLLTCSCAAGTIFHVPESHICESRIPSPSSAGSGSPRGAVVRWTTTVSTASERKFTPKAISTHLAMRDGMMPDTGSQLIMMARRPPVRTGRWRVETEMTTNIPYHTIPSTRRARRRRRPQMFKVAVAEQHQVTNTIL